MYYLQSRYYDPEICRFINSDDMHLFHLFYEDSRKNGFTYCNNNPTFNKDPDGYISDKDIKDFFNSIIVKIKNYISDYIKSLIVFRDGTCSISNTLIAKAIDTVIAIVITKVLSVTLKQVIKYLLERIAKKDPKKIYEIMKSVLTILNNKGVLFIVVKLIGYKAGMNAKLISSFINDFLTSIISNKSKIINKICVFVSAMSSIGGFIAFLLDCVDKYSVADGYFTIRYRR